LKTFPLQIGTPDGILYNGEVERVVVRSITGEMAVLAGHINYVTALGMGGAHVILPDGTRRDAACIGGMLSVMNGSCRVLATTWEWEDEIDRERAEAAKVRAQEKLNEASITDREYKIFKAKLQRALVRLSVKS